MDGVVTETLTSPGSAVATQLRVARHDRQKLSFVYCKPDKIENQFLEVKQVCARSHFFIRMYFLFLAFPPHPRLEIKPHVSRS